MESKSQQQARHTGRNWVHTEPRPLHVFIIVQKCVKPEQNTTWMKSSMACFNCSDALILYVLHAWPCPLYLPIDWLQHKRSLKVQSPEGALIHKACSGSVGSLCTCKSWFTHSPDTFNDFYPLTSSLIIGIGQNSDAKPVCKA